MLEFSLEHDKNLFSHFNSVYRENIVQSNFYKLFKLKKNKNWQNT
jgi:hypothetical protein